MTKATSSLFIKKKFITQAGPKPKPSIQWVQQQKTRITTYKSVPLEQTINAVTIGVEVVVI